MVENLPAMQETQVRSLDQEDPLEKGMAPHSNILTWTIPWTQQPGPTELDMTERLTLDKDYILMESSFFFFECVFSLIM